MPDVINRISVSNPEPEAFARLKSAGKLTICTKKGEDNQPTILFKRAGILDRLYARFFMSREERYKRAKMVVNHLKELLKIEHDYHWLLDNISNKIAEKGVIKGDFLAKNIGAFYTRFELKFDQRLVAPKSGKAVALVNESPDRVEATYQVFLYKEGEERARRALPSSNFGCDTYAETEYKDAEEKFDNYFYSSDKKTNWGDAFARFDGNVNQSDIAVVPPAKWIKGEGEGEGEGEGKGEGKATVTPEQVFRLLGKSLHGSVVMEPLPDCYFQGFNYKPSGPTAEIFSDVNLEAQLGAAYAINPKNNSWGDSVVITFATEDPALFGRLNEINSKLIKEFEKR